MKKLFSLLLFYTSTTYSMFCPSNFNQIEIGDTIEKVQQQCGKPTEEKKFQSSPSLPQEWVYYLQMPLMVSPTPEGTLKMTVAFEEEKVVNLSTNGIGVGATTICGPNIQLGDTMEKVKQACGKPVIINESKPSAEVKPTDVVEWKYQGPPPTTLTFENGKLTKRSS